MNTIEGLELAIASADSMIEKCRIITVQHIDEITRLKAELAAAHQEIAALKGDAERYQHLKANNTWASWLAINYKPNAWDEKIDAAMQGKDE